MLLYKLKIVTNAESLLTLILRLLPSNDESFTGEALLFLKIKQFLPPTPPPLPLVGWHHRQVIIFTFQEHSLTTWPFQLTSSQNREMPKVHERTFGKVVWGIAKSGSKTFIASKPRYYRTYFDWDAFLQWTN